jgi:hypothetical protein
MTPRRGFVEILARARQEYKDKGFRLKRPRPMVGFRGEQVKHAGLGTVLGTVYHSEARDPKTAADFWGMAESAIKEYYSQQKVGEKPLSQPMVDEIVKREMQEYGDIVSMEELSPDFYSSNSKPVSVRKSRVPGGEIIGKSYSIRPGSPIGRELMDINKACVRLGFTPIKKHTVIGIGGDSIQLPDLGRKQAIIELRGKSIGHAERIEMIKSFYQRLGLPPRLLKRVVEYETRQYGALIRRHETGRASGIPEVLGLDAVRFTSRDLRKARRKSGVDEAGNPYYIG